MAINIYTKDYLKGFKWSLLPKNSVDTVKGTYIQNKISDEPEVVASAVVTEVNFRGVNMKLPLDPGVPANVASADSNIGTYRNMSGGFYTDNVRVETAYARIHGAFAQVNVTMKSKLPVASGARLSVTLKGKTRQRAHGSLAYKDMDISSFASLYDLLINQPEENFSGDSVGQDYSKGKTVICPFLKADIANEGNVGGSQLWAQWDFNPTSSGTMSVIKHEPGKEEGWYYYNRTDEHLSKAKGSITGNTMWYLKFVQNIVTSFQQLDQYTFAVSLYVPVKVMGGAKARTVMCDITWDGQGRANMYYNPGKLIDSFAFMDILHSIELSISGKTINTSKFDFNYSLTNNNELTTNLKNVDIFSFIDNELVTDVTTWGDYNWKETVSKYILKNYKKGKYQVEFEMYLTKFLSKNININSELIVYQLNNIPIRRDNEDAIFIVKNLEYRQENGGFIVRVKAVERVLENVDAYGAHLIYTRFYKTSDADSHAYLVDLNDNSVPWLTKGNGQGALPYGYSVSLTSSITKVNPSDFYLPGNKIGSRVAILIRSKINLPASNFRIGVRNTSDGTTILDSEVFTSTLVSGELVTDYLYLGVVDISDIKDKVTLCIYCESVPADPENGIAVGVYNVGNSLQTKWYIMYYIKNNNLVPNYR